MNVDDKLVTPLEAAIIEQLPPVPAGCEGIPVYKEITITPRFVRVIAHDNSVRSLRRTPAEPEVKRLHEPAADELPKTKKK